MRVVTFKIDEDTLEELNFLALKLGMSRSELIRQAIQLFLKMHRNRIAPPRVVRLNS